MTLDITWLEERVMLHKLHENEVKILNDVFDIEYYNVGDEIISQGVAGGKLQLLRAGSAVISHREKEKSVFLNEVKEGAVFGEMSFFSGTPPWATVTAHTNCVTYELDRNDYCKLMVQSQDMVLSLFTHILAHTTEVIQRMNMNKMSDRAQIPVLQPSFN